MDTAFLLLLAVAQAVASFETPRSEVWRWGSVSMYRPWLAWERTPSGRIVPRPGRYACRPRKRPRQSDRVCASRTLPCGTVLELARRDRRGRNRRARCVVLDRGPYGACVPMQGVENRKKRRRVQSRRCPPGYRWIVLRRSRMTEAQVREGYFWRAHLDLAESVTRRLGGRGMLHDVKIRIVRRR